MGIVLATFLSTRPPTLHALSFATKDSIFTVQSAEHARLIINGVELWPYAKASYYYFRASKILSRTFLKYCLKRILAFEFFFLRKKIDTLKKNFDTTVFLGMFSLHFEEYIFYKTLLRDCFCNFKRSYTLESIFTLFVEEKLNVPSWFRWKLNYISTHDLVKPTLMIHLSNMAWNRHRKKMFA